MIVEDPGYDLVVLALAKDVLISKVCVRGVAFVT